jgi:predicted amidohydrolase
MSDWLLAGYQGSSAVGDKKTNLLTMKNQIKRASDVGAKLIIFPEMYTTGYMLPNGPQDVMLLAESHDGPSYQQISSWAKEFSIAVIYGYCERATRGEDMEALYYNSAQFIDKDGSSRANFRKLHLWPEVDSKIFNAGSELPIVNYEGVNIAMMICYDVEFPEIVRKATLKGANLVAVPTAVEAVKELVLIRARALENHIFVAYVNRCGKECDTSFYGKSSIVSPSGEPLVSTGNNECLMLANINIDLCSPKKFSYLKDRRPELYN